MDSVSMIVTALALGAATGHESAVGKPVRDAYEEIKELIKRRYRTPLSIGLLEAEPESEATQGALRKVLARLNAGSDYELLAQAKTLLDLVREYTPEVPESIGIRLEDAVAASLTLDDIISSCAAEGTNKLET